MEVPRGCLGSGRGGRGAPFASRQESPHLFGRDHATWGFLHFLHMVSTSELKKKGRLMEHFRL